MITKCNKFRHTYLGIAAYVFKTAESSVTYNTYLICAIWNYSSETET